MIWSPERLKALQDRYSTDGPAVLSREWGCSKNALIGKARRMGLTNSATPYVAPRRSKRVLQIEQGPPPVVTNSKRKCAWPVSGHGRHTEFCCEPVEIRLGRSLPYCPDHAKRAFVRKDSAA